MNILTIVGLAAAIIAALYLTFAAVIGGIATLELTGKVDPIVCIVAALAVAAWYFIAWSWPFELVMKGGAA